MTNELSVNPVFKSINARALTAGQANLYKYLEACAKANIPVGIREICEIYYTQVKRPDALFITRFCLYWQNKFGPKSPVFTLKNKDAYEFFSTPQYRQWFEQVYLPSVKVWLRGAIGGLVMRGLLTIIPKLDTALLEQPTKNED